MASGSFDLTGATGPMSVAVTAPYVYLYSPSGAATPLQWLPNVVFLGVSERTGPTPSTATFEYIQDDNLGMVFGWPSRIDQIWPLDASGPYVLQSDDRLLVVQSNPDGTPVYLFDGFAQIPQADITDRSERATFTAIGVAIREFDSTIVGRFQRNGDPTGIQDTTGNSDIAVGMPCRFNPADRSYGDDSGYRPNKTPANYDTNPVDSNGNSTGPAHPVFTEENIQGRPINQSPAYWSIPDAIRYILATSNSKSTYTQYPALSTLTTLLQSAYAAPGAPITAGDITTDPLLIRDYDASNKPWPEAVADLLRMAGFLMRWDLETDDNGNPATYLRFYRADLLSQTPVKSVYLDDPGNSLASGSANNATRLHLARDSNAIVNAFAVEAAQREVEITVYLAPLYQPASSDATLTTPASTTTGRAQFIRANLEANGASATTRRKYRWYGADELGDGQWSSLAGSWITGQKLDLSTVFPPDSPASPNYVARYRPGVRQLAATDSLGVPLHARLDIAFGVGSSGGEVQPSGTNYTWFPIEGGWRLLRDRLGIEVTAEDPENWTTGNPSLPRIAGISWWASPPSLINNTIPTNGLPPLLRLTCLIRGDHSILAAVANRPASPTQFARWRTVDARDHFAYTTINSSSVNYANAGPMPNNAPIVVRDDTTAATSFANALQRAHEMPPLAGTVTIPGIVTYYEIGDRIATIAGRDIALYQSAGSLQGELPTYPTIVGRSIRCEDRFYTELHLCDFRGERPESNAY